MAPFVSIVMPCYNERHFIEACLAGVLTQDYPKDRLEVLVTDGMSDDGTRAILFRLAKEDPRIRIIDNPDRLQAPGMNRAIKAARGEIVMRMDVHAEYASDYVSQCVRVLEETGADNVGGSARPRADTPFRRALCAALDSFLAVGGSKYRSADEEGYVDTVFLGTFRRRLFERVGLYDPKAITNEDAELNQRIREQGGSVYLSRDIVAYYYPRDSFRSLAKQYWKYGQGRARTLLKHGKPQLRPMTPFLFVAGSVALVAMPSLRWLSPLWFGGYALATFAEAVRIGVKHDMPSEIPRIWAIFPILHVSHGAGFARGLLHYLQNPDWEDPELLPSAPAAPASP